MKKIFTGILMLLLAANSVWAQSPLDRFFQKYENDPAFTVITISPKMFNMFSKVDLDDKDAESILNVAKKLTGLHILANENAPNALELFKEAGSSLSRNYDDLMTVRSHGNDLRFLVKDDPNGNIRELIMLIGGSNKFFALSLTGNINLAEISQISKDMNIQGFDQLDNLKNKSTSKK